MGEGRIFVAASTATFPYEGRDVTVARGRTTAREGHPLLKARPDLFVPLVPDFELAPEPAPARRAKARPGGDHHPG